MTCVVDNHRTQATSWPSARSAAPVPVEILGASKIDHNTGGWTGGNDLVASNQLPTLITNNTETIAAIHESLAWNTPATILQSAQSLWNRNVPRRSVVLKSSQSPLV